MLVAPHVMIYRKNMPSENPHMYVVSNLTELANTAFGSHNLLILRRTLKGDFNGLAYKLLSLVAASEAQPPEDKPFLKIGKRGLFYQQGLEKLGIELSPGEEVARNEILTDMRFINGHKSLKSKAQAQLRVIPLGGYSPSLFERIKNVHDDIRYFIENREWPQNTNVYRFHADGEPDADLLRSREARYEKLGIKGRGQFGCCYNDPATENLLNDDAVYRDYIYFDKKRGAPVRHDITPMDLFRHQAFTTDPAFKPFVHRAPKEGFFSPPRLLLRG